VGLIAIILLLIFLDLLLCYIIDIASYTVCNDMYVHDYRRSSCVTVSSYACTLLVYLHYCILLVFSLGS
jgi:hypothetical protein